MHARPTSLMAKHGAQKRINEKEIEVRTLETQFPGEYAVSFAK